jgi:hypothetical protein
MHHHGKLGRGTLRPDNPNANRAGRADRKNRVFNGSGWLFHWNGLGARQNLASGCWREVVQRWSGGNCVDELLSRWLEDWRV